MKKSSIATLMASSDISLLEKQAAHLVRELARWNKVYVWALFVALIAGAITFWAQRQSISLSGKLSDAKDEIGRAKDDNLQRDLKAKDEQISEANQRTAKLEKEAADARLELAKIDPLNLPIKSLKADVSLVARGKFFESHFAPPDDPKKTCRVSISITDGGGVATMLCHDFESFPITMEQGGFTIRDARTFSMSFVWPYGDWFQAQFAQLQKQAGLLDLVDRDTISTAELDELLDNKSAILQILMMPSDGDVEILMSSFVLTINSSIQRKFSIPTRSNLGILNCTPQKD